MKVFKEYQKIITLKINKSRDEIKNIITTQTHKPQITGDVIEITFRPTIIDSSQPKGSIQFILNIITDNQTEIICKISTFKQNPLRLYALLVLFILFSLLSLLLSFSLNSWLIIVISWIIFYGVLYLSKKLNEGKLENEAMHIINKLKLQC